MTIKQELTADMARRDAYAAQIAELQEKINIIDAKAIAYARSMRVDDESSTVVELAGRLWRVYWERIEMRFDSSRFKKENPDAVKPYMKESPKKAYITRK